eukprot:snap_masked-scaffold_23-processed-gene-2.41-mRNA-1 protein AED:1.00 eAED:1.00 QI:0/0/0/0/1/1/3/0/59
MFLYVDNQPDIRITLNETAAGRNQYLDTRFQFANIPPLTREDVCWYSGVSLEYQTYFNS